MRRKILSVFLILWALVMLPMTAFAQEFTSYRLGSISVTLTSPDGTTPITGAELSVYRVATVSLNSNGNLSYIFTDVFEDCGCSLEDPALPIILDTFVTEKSVSATKLVTDTQGKVHFTNLPLGLYFVKQTGAVTGYAHCTSFLVTVPSKVTGGYEYDVNASPKTDVTKLTDITVKKVWNTGSASKATSSVTVQLLKDGVVIETATLNAQNNWQVTYSNMPESDTYSIKEVSVPQGFTATYSKSGYVFTVTNTPSLIQSGQLVWPIPVLALAGLCLIAVGSIVLRKSRNEHA